MKEKYRTVDITCELCNNNFIVKYKSTCDIISCRCPKCKNIIDLEEYNQKLGCAKKYIKEV